MGFIDLIFPKRCVSCRKTGSYLCANCFSYLSFDAKSLCLVCNKPSFNNLTHPTCLRRYSINGCFSALTYNKTAQKLIYNFKYKPYLTDIKNVLSDLFYESIIQDENFNKELAKGLPAGRQGEWIFVPVPLYASKLRKRGYNQAEILAKELSKKFNLSAGRQEFSVKNVLKRTRDTKTQVGLSNLKRKENIKDAFALKPQGINLKTQNVFLVDDVVTTGSTLNEAAKSLKKGGAKRVIGLTLARD